MVFAFQSIETRWVSRPLRSSMYSCGRGPWAPTLPWLVRFARPSSAYTPLPFQVSTRTYAPFRCSRTSTTSAIVLPLRLSSNSISIRAGGVACARASSARHRLISSQDKLRIAAFHVDHVVAKSKPAVQEPAQRAGIHDMLLLQHARGERRRIIVRAHAHRRLDHDRPVVELRSDEMHRAAMHLDAGLKRALVRVQSGKRRQERRMNVEQALAVARHERRGKDAHEAGERHYARRAAVNLGGERGVEGFARGMRAMLDH